MEGVAPGILAVGIVAAGIVATLSVIVLGIHLLTRRLTRKQKKLLLKRRLRHLWRWLEERGLVEKNPALIRDYHRHYPALALLERHADVIRKECLELMAQREKIPHIKDAGGRYTTRGIHEIEWRTFMLKSGRFLDANCRRAPETTRLLREVPDVETAFFSILGPKQHIRAHWGYYKGFWRYHLALVVPNDNRDRSCWLRVNDDRRAYDKRIRSVIEQTEKYYWHEGEGIVFDDTYLHDAANESDAPRAVLFLDLKRPLPWYLDLPNRLFLRLVRLDPTLREIHRDAVMRD
ncbi:MAG: aspartyl/asparaginyl beta-hydroxylase domain-containing protein [Myxococcota bacterium]